MSNFVAVYDACVLYPPSLRDLLMHLAVSGLFRARWTARIQDAWVSAHLRQRPELSNEALQWTRTQMNIAVPDGIVRGCEGLEVDLQLPDPDDRHVLAAAIMCHAGTIVTYNLKDFPDEALVPFGITAQHPDQFIEHAFDLHPAVVIKAVRDHRASLHNPPKTVEELFDSYQRRGLATTVALSRPNTELL